MTAKLASVSSIPITAHAIRAQLHDALRRLEEQQAALSRLDDVVRQLRRELRLAEKRER